MSSHPPGRGGQSPDADAVLSLKHADLPARPRAVLEALLGVASTVLEGGVAQTLNEFEQQLFKMAEQARSNDQQNRCFEALREVRRVRADVAPRFLIRLETALASLGTVVEVAKEFARVPKAGREEFALVDPQELEQSLAMQEVASKAEIRHSQALFALGQRFGVLAGSAAIEAEELPVGPQRLCTCFRGAAQNFDLPIELRVQLYRAFDRTCMTNLGELYEQLNDQLVKLRILPNLQLSHTRGKRTDAPAQGANTQRTEAEVGRAEPGVADSSGDAPPQGMGRPGAMPGYASQIGQNGYAGMQIGEPSAASRAGSTSAPAATGASSPGSPPFAAPGGGGTGRGGGMRAPMSPGAAPGTNMGHRPGAAHSPTPSPAGMPADSGYGGGAGAGDVADIPGMRGHGNPMTGWPGTPASQADVGNHYDTREAELFETMRDLLAGRRVALGIAGVGEGSMHEVRTDDVQSVLSALQSKPAPPMMIGGKLVSRSVSHLKQDMLTQLRQLTPEGKPARLNDMDADTVDLVGMLFDHLGKNVKADSSVQQLMTRLQIPLLRVALRDKSFFTRRTHPARQLLNAVAEAGLFWLDDEAEDRTLVEKMRMVVDRVTAEYDDDLDVFEELLGDLSKHLNTLARKSEVAERRHVDAAKGRERLDLARQSAAAAIAERVNKRNPPALIKTLLEQAWTDVLALTLLRQGENSEVYRRRLGVADEIIDTLVGDGNAVQPLRADDSRAQGLKQEIESGLSQVGYHVEDVQTVVKRLFGSSEKAANDDPTSLTELAVKLKQRSRLGGEEEKDAKGAPRAPVKETIPLNAEEQRVQERLRTVPFGTWFEFTLNQQGDVTRRKLSWFSTVTGRCLFVNQRGARTEEKSLEQLSREIVRGTARVVEATKESLIDRAWGAIMSTLKQFSAKPALAETKPA
jgi:hypothetical protein